MARISATSLLTSNYFKLSEPSKTEFSNLFLSLCNDSTPLVRRAAAMNFSKIIKGVSHVTIQTDYIVAFNNFASHEQVL
jgi:serine/threonine-protein phosphatase 2A regulatory subunit A